MKLLTCVEADCGKDSEDRSAEHEVSLILQEQLRRSRQADLRQVRVSAGDGIVRLLGRVASFHAKQVAQVTIREHSGGWRVDNAIEVA